MSLASTHARPFKVSKRKPSRRGRYANRPLTDEQSRLAGDPEVLAVAERIAGHYIRRAPSMVENDLRSASLLGVVYAARIFDPARGIPFTAYAAYRVRHEIRSFLRIEGDYPCSLDSCGPDGGSIAEMVPFDLEAGGF